MRDYQSNTDRATDGDSRRLARQEENGFVLEFVNTKDSLNKVCNNLREYQKLCGAFLGNPVMSTIKLSSFSEDSPANTLKRRFVLVFQGKEINVKELDGYDKLYVVSIFSPSTGRTTFLEINGELDDLKRVLEWIRPQ